MQMAAANLTRVTLELGGNDPAIVLDDAAFDEAEIARMAMATYMTTGQVCMALKRLYVPRSALRRGRRTASRASSGTPSSAAASTRT